MHIDFINNNLKHEKFVSILFLVVVLLDGSLGVCVGGM